MHERYNKNVMAPILEERKKELACKRNNLKPITKEIIDEHMKQHDIMLVQRDDARKKEIEARRAIEHNIQKFIDRFKTPILQKQSMIELGAKNEMKRKLKEKQMLRAKMGNYSELIKESNLKYKSYKMTHISSKSQPKKKIPKFPEHQKLNNKIKYYINIK